MVRDVPTCLGDEHANQHIPDRMFPQTRTTGFHGRTRREALRRRSGHERADGVGAGRRTVLQREYSETEKGTRQFNSAFTAKARSSDPD